MALVVFLRGINVGGHRTFRPTILARGLSDYGLVNVGAAGTFVVRKPGSRARFRAALLRKLPFEAEVVRCDGRDLLLLVEKKNPFATEPSRPDVLRFVSILSKVGRGPADIGLNTRGTLFAVQKALPLFNDGGSIFMTGSVASVKGFPGYGVYSASKAALRSFARTWLNELKGRNIRVNVLSPGPIATPMQDQVLTEEAKRMFESLIPRGKMGRPEEIAAVALFLASDDSSFVNGVELSVDGGFSAI